MRAVVVSALGLLRYLVARPGEVRFPCGPRGSIVIERRRGIARTADIEQQARDRTEVVGEQGAMRVVESQDALAHREVLGPLAELHLGARECVVAIDDRRVERRHQRRMEEVE